MTSKKTSPHSKDDYQVGYGRPPETTRFRPGESGNPQGRPKRRATFASVAKQELERPVSTGNKAGGPVQQMPAMEVIVKNVVRAAVYGDLKAARLLVDLEAVERKSGDTEHTSNLPAFKEGGAGESNDQE
jgi:hypothetical protein